MLSQIYVDMPPTKSAPSRTKAKYDALKEIFQNEDEQDEFFGFEESENIDLDVLFLRREGGGIWPKNHVRPIS